MVMLNDNWEWIDYDKSLPNISSNNIANAENSPGVAITELFIQSQHKALTDMRLYDIIDTQSYAIPWCRNVHNPNQYLCGNSYNTGTSGFARACAVVVLIETTIPLSDLSVRMVPTWTPGSFWPRTDLRFAVERKKEMQW